MLDMLDMLDMLGMPHVCRHAAHDVRFCPARTPMCDRYSTASRFSSKLLDLSNMSEMFTAIQLQHHADNTN